MKDVFHMYIIMILLCFNNTENSLLKLYCDTSGCETDNQIDGVAKLAPIVACYAGKPEMLERVEEAIRVTQNNDMCVAVTLAAARLVLHIIYQMCYFMIQFRC